MTTNEAGLLPGDELVPGMTPGLTMYMTTTEAGARLGVSSDTIRRVFAAGKLRGIRTIGGRVLLLTEAVEEARVRGIRVDRPRETPESIAAAGGVEAVSNTTGGHSWDALDVHPYLVDPAAES